MGLISDIKRHFATARAMEQGTMPPYQGKDIKLPDYKDCDDSYNLPDHARWIINGKMYQNAGEAKAASINEQRLLGNNY